MTHEHVALSVVVPVFNGESFIARAIRDLISALARLPVAAELIVVDDGSTDATAALVQQAMDGAAIPVLLMRRKRNQGKGAAIAAGMQRARGDHRVFVDADLAYPPESIEPIHAALAGGAEIAIACRTHPGSRLLLNPAFFGYYYRRHFVGRVFNLVVRLFLLPGIADSQAGLKGFRAAAAERLFSGWLPRGFSFDVALLFRARRLGLSIEQVPIFYRYLDEPSTVRFLRDTSRMLRDLVFIRLRLVGGRFERWTGVFSARWAELARRAAALLRSPAVGPVLGASLGLGVILLVIARLGLHSPILAPLGWIIALTSLLLLAWRADPAGAAQPSPLFRSRPEALSFFALLALTALVRFVWLGEQPPMEHGDSAECGLQGLAILRGEAPDIFSFSPWYQTPYLSFVPYALSFLLFDVSMWSLRLPSAVVGTAAVMPLYFLVRRWFGVRAALLAGALYALSHAAVHFSRIGLWNVQVLFYELCVYALVVSGLRRGSALRLAGAGVITGLALYAYTGGRLIPIVVAAYLAVELVAHRRTVLRAAGYYLAGIAVTVLPLLLNYYQDPSVLLADRSASVWVLSPSNHHHVESTLGTTDTVGVLWEQTKRTVLGFVTVGDTSTQYGTEQPLLAPITAIFALLGVAVALRHWRQPRYRFLFIWLVLGLLLGSVLVLDPPSYTRLVMLFPLPFIFVAVGLATTVEVVRRRRPLRRAEIVALYLLVAAQAGAFSAAGYYRFTVGLSTVSREWDVLQVFDRLGDDYDYYLYTGPFLLADAPVFRLFSNGTRTVSAFSEIDLPERLLRDTAFVLTPEEFRRLGLTISERFPGVDREVEEQDGVRKMIVYLCTEANGCRGGRS